MTLVRAISGNPQSDVDGAGTKLTELLDAYADAVEAIEALQTVAAHALDVDPHTGYRLESTTIGTTDLTNDAVTYAKLQNISATSRILGRITSGAGDAEELTAAQAKTLLALAASEITFTPTGTIAATNVQTAIAEAASEGLALGSTPSTQAFGDAAVGGVATTASKNDHKHAMPVGGVFSKGIAVQDSAGVPTLTVAAWTAPFACTVTAIKGYRVSGSGATIQAYRGTTGTPLRATALSLTSADTWMDGGAVQNTAFASGNSLLLAILSASGTPTQISVQVNFTRP